MDQVFPYMKTIIEMIRDKDPNLPTPQELILGIMLKEHPENTKENLEFYEKNKDKIKKLVKL